MTVRYLFRLREVHSVFCDLKRVVNCNNGRLIHNNITFCRVMSYFTGTKLEINKKI